MSDLDVLIRFTQGHALVVGAGGDLPNTVNDAMGVARILKDPERCAYPPDQVHLFTAERATRAAVLSAFDTLAQSTDPQSTILVYFSGHGYRVTSPTGEFYYLLPYGYDLDRLYRTAVGGAEFADRLRALPARKLLVLLDCCHAGGVGEAKAPGLQLLKAPLPPEARALLAEGGGRVLIASSREDEVSLAGKPYSAFTRALIEALCGAGVAKQDGYVRVADLAMYAREVVPRRTQERQHPILHFEHADNFALAYYAGGDVRPKGLPFAAEPQVEPEPRTSTVFYQRGQVVHGSQTNIVGDVHGPVLSGTFQGPVTIASRPSTDETLDLEPSPEATRLHRILKTRLDLEELRTLCFDLGVNYDDLGGEGLSGKARQLVLRLQKQDGLHLLLEWLRRERPDVGV
ncbi:MAG TPA: caspase family protein [Anaerolineae bacterium]|nr:caspase family protein [Anaerolineae bacterium]